jgi:hypothetical protein
MVADRVIFYPKAGRALRSDRPVALDLAEELLQDDPPPGDELAAGPVPSICRKPRTERVRARGGQDYRVEVDRARANRYAAATCCGVQATIFECRPFFLP